jgi:glycosyltransferase involved in cell wall biosynthesis
MAPRVSIGMPVYNDGPYVAQAIGAVLAQDFADFELVISDNASTDGTSEACEAFARRDPRVRYMRQPRNLGAVRNFKFVLEQARGEYFAWAGGHDVLDPAFVSACARELDADAEVVLAYPSISLIDGQGLRIQSEPTPEIDTRGKKPIVRVRRIISDLVSCHMLYGLFRRDILLRCRHGIVCRGPDHVLLMELSLYGAIAHVAHPLLALRENRGVEDRHKSYADYIRAQLLRLDPHAFSSGKLRPHWRWGWEHALGLLSANIPATTKAWLAPFVAATFLHRWRLYLVREVFSPLAER